LNNIKQQANKHRKKQQVNKHKKKEIQLWQIRIRTRKLTIRKTKIKLNNRIKTCNQIKTVLDLELNMKLIIKRDKDKLRERLF